MKANRVLAAQERLENVDGTIMQYITAIFDILDKVMDLIGLRAELIEQVSGDCNTYK